MTFKDKVKLWINASDSAGIEVPSNDVLAEEIGCSPSHVSHIRNAMDKPEGIRELKTKSINRQRK